MAERAEREVLRTQILRVAEAVHPKWFLEAYLDATLELSSADTYLYELDFDAHYIAEKGLLQMEKVKNWNKRIAWRIKLTARGLDYLEGRLKEVGLASTDLIH